MRRPYGGTEMKKENLEILLEDMNSKFELILEGHAALDRKIDLKFDELSEKIEHNSFKIDTLHKKIDAVAVDLKEHRSDTEAHRGVYRVKEG
jgi:hypothetical protein